MELLRCTINQQECKLDSTNRIVGYKNFNIKRRIPNSTTKGKVYIKNPDNAIRNEEHTIFKRHSKKWYALTDCDYPREPYFFDNRFGLPLELTDQFWYKNASQSFTNKPNFVPNSFTNETQMDLPYPITTFLAKGPTTVFPLHLILISYRVV